ncbi:MAG: nucleoside 2-deoxyribosyltransferase [Burkholderiaceae bacterium]|nr:nucleoside 2-deoxyribosyltransferase [Burkholderiaceae bacterium]
MTSYSVYLAGFDVFRQNASDYGRWLRSECAARGLVGVYPLDGTVPEDMQGPKAAAWIYRNNIKLINGADIVMANLGCFRGQEPDSGTAFEVGYAVALGKPVWGHLQEEGDMVARAAVGTDPAMPDRHIDSNGMTVEDFGLPLNLMLACSVTVVHGDALACLDRIVAAIGQRPTQRY